MLRIVVARRHEAGETHGGADRGGAAAAHRRFRVAPRNVQREAGVLVAVAQALTFPDPGFLFVGRQGIMVQRQEQIAAARRVGAGRQRGDPAIVVDRSHRDPARGQCRLHDGCQGPVEMVFTAATGTDRARVGERGRRRAQLRRPWPATRTSAPQPLEWMFSLAEVCRDLATDPLFRSVPRAGDRPSGPRTHHRAAPQRTHLGTPCGARRRAVDRRVGLSARKMADRLPRTSPRVLPCARRPPAHHR